MKQQKRLHWSSTIIAEKEEKVDVIAELLKEDEEDESTDGSKTACCLRYGTR